MAHVFHPSFQARRGWESIFIVGIGPKAISDTEHLEVSVEATKAKTCSPDDFPEMASYSESATPEV